MRKNSQRVQEEQKRDNPPRGCPSLRCADLLLGGCGFASFDFGGGVGVFLGEAFNAAGGVDELLFAGEERMAIGADFDVQHVALDGRTGSEIVAAGAVHRDGVIVGVDTGFHETPFCRVRSARPPQQG